MQTPTGTTTWPSLGGNRSRRSPPSGIDPGGVQFEGAELVFVDVLEEIDHLTVEE